MHDVDIINVQALFIRVPSRDSLSSNLSQKHWLTALSKNTSGQPNIPRGGPRATVNQERVFSYKTSAQREQIVRHILTKQVWFEIFKIKHLPQNCKLKAKEKCLKSVLGSCRLAVFVKA